MGAIERATRQAKGKAKETIAEVLGDGTPQAEAKAEQRNSEEEEHEEARTPSHSETSATSLSRNMNAAAPAATLRRTTMLHYPRPPFPSQHQPMPGRTGAMNPLPDHGETSYKGSGRLSGKKAIIQFLEICGIGLERTGERLTR